MVSTFAVCKIASIKRSQSPRTQHNQPCHAARASPEAQWLASNPLNCVTIIPSSKRRRQLFSDKQASEGKMLQKIADMRQFFVN